MEKKNIIILVLVVIIVALLVVIFASMPHTTKQDTNLTFKSNATITEGDSIQVKLADANGTAIANQTVNVTVTHKDKSSDYHSVVTNEKGTAKLKMNNDPGKYIITVTYGGNDKFNGCNATKKITIEEEAVEVESDSSSSGSDSSSPRYVNEENGLYDTYTDKYVGGQMDGSSKAEAEEYNQAIVEEEKAYKREHGL